ncbi:hypothetical protein CCR94_22130 [Rhodoblastus sphagnicola]|uniref:Uncharacterized protein n=1 Tax=Rhodoblastus sphagnicola TaxID=333368 RepID=A0A2S6MVF5_9HYPH|nr:hypothetical protein CCR94_22130 [Rhodoblastus sphagnicola]
MGSLFSHRRRAPKVAGRTDDTPEQWIGALRSHNVDRRQSVVSVQPVRNLCRFVPQAQAEIFKPPPDPSASPKSAKASKCPPSGDTVVGSLSLD